MTLYRYRGSTVEKSRLNDLLAEVIGDHEDEYHEAWQEWFGGYLESLDMERLWAEFVSDYLEENCEEVYRKHEDEIEEVDE